VTADELADDGDVLDLTAIALAHPARRVRLDMAAIESAGLLSVGDIVDMSERLHTDPAQLAAVLTAGDPSTPYEVVLALAWIVGRKADPGLSYDEVRTTWRVESVAARSPDPTPPKPPRQHRRRAHATSSG
jgi:hypothetical protein